MSIGENTLGIKIGVEVDSKQADKKLQLINKTVNKLNEKKVKVGLDLKADINQLEKFNKTLDGVKNKLKTSFSNVDTTQLKEMVGVIRELNNLNRGMKNKVGLGFTESSSEAKSFANTIKEVENHLSRSKELAQSFAGSNGLKSSSLSFDTNGNMIKRIDEYRTKLNEVMKITRNANGKVNDTVTINVEAGKKQLYSELNSLLREQAKLKNSLITASEKETQVIQKQLVFNNQKRQAVQEALTKNNLKDSTYEKEVQNLKQILQYENQRKQIKNEEKNLGKQQEELFARAKANIQEQYRLRTQSLTAEEASLRNIASQMTTLKNEAREIGGSLSNAFKVRLGDFADTQRRKFSLSASKNADRENVQSIKLAYNSLEKAINACYEKKIRLTSLKEGKNTEEIAVLKQEVVELERVIQLKRQAINAKGMSNTERENSLLRTQEQLVQRLKQAKAQSTDSSNREIEAQKRKITEFQQLYQSKLANLKVNMKGFLPIVELERFEQELRNLDHISLNDLKAQTQRLKENFNSIKTAASQARRENEVKSTSLIGGLGNLAKFQLSNMATNFIYSSFSNGANAILELDNAMTELKKVANDSDKTLEQFGQTANQIAISVGHTTVDTMNATTEAIKVGFSNLNEAKEIAKQTLVYSNVGDVSQEEASKSLVSIMKSWQDLSNPLQKVKAFGKEMTNLDRIMDILNYTGNNFAITSGGIGNALQRSSSALATANNTFEQSVAMITAANASVQNTEKVGTAMKTISMRLRGMKIDKKTGERIPVVAQGLKEIAGIDITKANGGFKTTYEILGELSKVYNKLNDQNKATIIELIAGKQHGNVIASLMSNWKDVKTIMKEVEDKNSQIAGSAAREQERYMDSVQGRVNAFKETVKGMWTNLVSSKDSKMMLGFGNDVLSMLNKATEKFGAFPTILSSISMAMSVFKKDFSGLGDGLLKILKNTDKSTIKGKINDYIEKQREYIEQQRTLQSSLSNGEQAVSRYSRSIVGLNAKIGVAKLSTFALEGAMMALEGALTLGVTVALDFAIKAISDWIHKTEIAQEKIDEIHEKSSKSIETHSGNVSSLEGMKKEFDELNKKQKKTKEEQQKFNNLLKEVEKIAPEAVLGHDINGNPYINLENGLQSVIDKEKEIIKLEQERLAMNASEELQNADSKYKESNNKLAFGQGDLAIDYGKKMGIINSFFNGTKTKEDFQKELADIDKDIEDFIKKHNGQLEEYKKIQTDKMQKAIIPKLNINTEFNNLSTEYKNSLVQFFNNMELPSLNASDTNLLIDNMVAMYKKAPAEIAKVAEEVNTAKTAFNNNHDLQTYKETLSSIEKEFVKLGGNKELFQNAFKLDETLYRPLTMFEMYVERARQKSKDGQVDIESLTTKFGALSNALKSIELNPKDMVGIEAVRDLAQQFPEIGLRFGEQIKKGVVTSDLDKFVKAYISDSFNFNNMSDVKLDFTFLDEKLANPDMNYCEKMWAKQRASNKEMVESVYGEAIEMSKLKASETGAIIAQDLGNGLVLAQPRIVEAGQETARIYINSILATTNNGSSMLPIPQVAPNAMQQANTLGISLGKNYTGGIEQGIKLSPNPYYLGAFTSTSGSVEAFGYGKQTGTQFSSGITDGVNSKPVDIKKPLEKTPSTAATVGKQAGESFSNSFKSGMSSIETDTNNTLRRINNNIDTTKSKLQSLQSEAQKGGSVSIPQPKASTPTKKNFSTRPSFSMDSISNTLGLAGARMSFFAMPSQDLQSTTSPTVSDGNSIHNGGSGFMSFATRRTTSSKKSPRTHHSYSKYSKKTEKKSEKKKTEEKVEDLKLEINLYQKLEDSIKNVNYALDVNRKKQKYANGYDRYKYLQAEVSLMKQKQDLLMQMKKSQLNEAWKIRGELGSKYGFYFDKSANVTNYVVKLQQLQAQANSKSGEAKKKAIENVKKVKDSIDKYLKIIFTDVPNAVEQWEELSNSIKDVYVKQIDLAKNMQDKVTEALKKQVEERKKLIDEEFNKKKDNLKKEQDLYKKNKDEKDYDKKLKKEMDKLNSLQAQISELERDTSKQGRAKLDSLYKDLKEQQESVQDLVTEHTDKEVDEWFSKEEELLDKQSSKLKDTLDKNYDDKNLTRISKEAIINGYFKDIDGNVKNTQQVLLEFTNAFDNGLSVAGDKIKTELINNLSEAQQILKNMSSLTSNLGYKSTTTSFGGFKQSTTYSTVPTNNVTIVPLPTNVIKAYSSAIKAEPSTNNNIDVNFNVPLLSIQGNVTKDTLPSVQELTTKVKNMVTKEIVRAIK